MADDVKGTQAAPDFPLTVPKGYTPEQVVTHIEQAAVRAALDGLRAEVGDSEPKLGHEGIVWLPLDAILAIIDARLAALDA